MTPIDGHEGKKYLRRIHPASRDRVLVDAREGTIAIEVDVYAVLQAFGVTCPARAHAVKKLLCAGGRGKGSELDDLTGAHAAVCRAIELQRQRDRDAEPRVGNTSEQAQPGTPPAVQTRPDEASARVQTDGPSPR